MMSLGMCAWILCSHHVVCMQVSIFVPFLCSISDRHACVCAVMEDSRHARSSGAHLVSCTNQSASMLRASHFDIVVSCRSPQPRNAQSRTHVPSVCMMHLMFPRVCLCFPIMSPECPFSGLPLFDASTCIGAEEAVAHCTGPAQHMPKNPIPREPTKVFYSAFAIQKK